MKLIKLICLILLLGLFIQAGSIAFAICDTVLTIIVPDFSGDTNGDKTVNVSDVIHLIRYILNSEVSLSGDCDYNGDGRVDLADVVRLLRYVINPSTALYKTT